jgi:uncharacterized protein YjbI with pentapeptide repeats
MESRQIRHAKILQPSADVDHLTPADQPPARGDCSDLRVRDADWSRWQVTDRNISGCHLSNVTLVEVRMEDARITNSIFDNCDFASARWTDVKIDRTVFRGCRLIGLNATTISLANVIFDNCRLDYASLTAIRATGPVAFTNCRLSEITISDSRLDGVIIADSPMPGAQLIGTTMRGADLRGSDLATLTGATCLAAAIIDDSQVPQLTDALLAELQIQIQT